MKRTSVERAVRVVDSSPAVEDLEKSITNLLVPVGSHSFQEEGEFAVENADHRITCSYGPIRDVQDVQAIHLVEHGLGWRPSKAWRELTSLRWGVHGQNIDVLGALPGGITVFFSADIENGQAGIYLPAEKCIVLSGNLLAPGQLIVLLHEIGHSVDIKLNRNSDELLRSEEFQYERSANAFALNALRPSFRANDIWKSDVKNWLIHTSLHDYAQRHIATSTPPDLRLSVGDYEDLLYDEMYDG